MRKAIITSMLILAVALCAAGAYATSHQIVQYSGTISDFGDSGWVYWNVTPFDSTLGTLTGVSIDLNTVVDGGWSLTNKGKGILSTSGYASIITEAMFGVDPLISGQSVSYAYDSWNTVIWNKGDSIGGPLHVEDTQHFLFDSTYNLSSFNNPWEVDFVNWADFAHEEYPSNASSSNYVSGNASAVVTYDYQPVPEPSSLLVLVAGGAGMFGFIKRRRTN